MAKSSRASTIKSNNRRLKKNVFGPVEAARIERLSSKLLEIASQPKPPRPVPEEEMVDAQEEEAMEIEKDETAIEAKTDEMAMDVDGEKKPESTTKKSSGGIRKRKIEKKRKPKNSIVFRTFKDRQTKKKKRAQLGRKE